MENVFFITQAKHNKTNNAWEKGCVVKNAVGEDNKAAALQTYHAYLGAYAYGHDPNTDYVFAQIIEAKNGAEIIKEFWKEN